MPGYNLVDFEFFARLLSLFLAGLRNLDHD